MHVTPHALAAASVNAFSNVPAIAVGSGFTALGALRSIHDAGIDAYLACPPGDLARHSRWYRPPPGAEDWDGSPTSAAEFLAATKLDCAALIPCADDIALWLAENNHAGVVAGRYQTSIAPAASMHILQDKARFAEWLATSDVPSPRSFPIANDAQLATVPFDTLQRVFIKPVDSQTFSRVTGVKGIWVNGADDCRRSWNVLRAQGHAALLQEYVPGPVRNHVFVDGFRTFNGDYPGLFARRRKRIYPPDFGNSTYCTHISTDEIAPAVAAVRRLLDALDYRGIFSAEFKQDERDGEYRILEVNTRAWWYVEFAARCGVNVCEMAWLDACLQQVPTAKPRVPGTGCVNWIEDANALRHLSQGKLHVVRDWLRAYEHVFRLNDPGPAVHRISAQIRRSAAKRLLISS